MSRSILVPHDGSTNAQAAFRYALETFPNARIVLFHAIDPFEVTASDEQLAPLTDDWLDEQRSQAERLLEDAQANLELDGHDDDGNRNERLSRVEIETETGVGSPAQVIVAAVDETDTDQIVIGNRGQSGAAGARMGSTAETVVKRSDVPVTVVR
ncbi:UspA domain protein (plasmid) [Natrialba magadii ATCC 43099]|uniref:UspA domain protein n=1 Tax=Natrialba magadii (strain ATCC 43099 / DSM 3394 / CCM 3739 / CIP 104546 / IAM 13178 / JCM 8861 / NBRC 102185 / NCIMB 2190 / MS3) TaxID=547559 RepID=D3T1A4_NATMM|nr:universal stress protein [Natrialba magadii]ADD07363.2 UspA domain protein [Natrialba magadii ATCC 43099]ELY32433.1 UspA domain-containing protein [Natrialba magadii ATCC 43099]